MEKKLVKSGIPGLDAVLGGGFLENSIVTVSGPTGCGKSTLAAQFLHNGAADSNEPGLYISIEESRNDFFFHNAGYKWDFKKLEVEKKFILLDYPVYEVDHIINQVSAIQEIIATTGVRRVVIDSIMPIALYFKESDDRKKGFLKFMENMRKWKATTLIVSEDITTLDSEHVPNTGYEIESFTDGWVNLFYRYDEQKMERARYLEVLKMKGMSHSQKSYLTKIDENGMRVMMPEPVKVPDEEIKKAITLPAPLAERQTKPVKAPVKSDEGSAKIAAVKKKLLKRK
jgi:KaiC/GvpD/RAD55 family RecA-like ATPase